MYIQYRRTQLIEKSGRPDNDNEAILRGDYLDKTSEDFIMPNRDKMMKHIFSDWQKGDILVIADSPLKYPKLKNGILVEMTREEVCQSGDLSILYDGEIYENGIIKTIERPQGVKIEWQYPQWIEVATLEEQLEYYKQQILNTTRELLIYKESGFANVELENKLKEFTEKHNNIAYDIAIQENKMLNL